MPKKFRKEPVIPRNRTIPPVQTEEFKAHQFEAAPDVPEGVKLAKNAVCVNLPEDHDRYVRSRENKTVWMREAVREKIERDRGGELPEPQPKSTPSLDELQLHINAVLMSIRPRERAEAARLFKKLTDRLGNAEE